MLICLRIVWKELIMKIFTKLSIICCFLFSSILVVTGCSNKNENLCTDELIIDLISTKFSEEHDTQKLWHKLKENGHFKEQEDENTRSKFVNMQFLFESTLASMLKDKLATKVISVIYTPLPSTPLRTDGNNLDLLLSAEDMKNPDILNTIVSRYESVHEYLENDGMLYNIYKTPTNESEIPGIDIYRQNLKTYPSHLIDTPTDIFENKFTGAAYLVQCENGQQIFFSISSKQINEQSDKKEWEIYYGSLSNKKIKAQFKDLKNLYAKSSVNFELN